MVFRNMTAAVVCLSTGLALGVGCPVQAADWPMWRYDASRSAASPEELPAALHLQWVREYPPLKPAWPDQPKMPFDTAYEPVVLGKTLFVGSSWSDSVTALDTETGAEKWRFYTDGPVRFAPVAWQGKVYFVSDDGYLYCVDAAKGALLWKFRGGPADRRILGNERLISTWPARGAPVIADGTLYFAASIWPFMGIFIHALDAQTGKVIWTNDGDGALYMKQPHNADSFAGVAPQGPLVVAGDVLLIPGGRSVPACYDRKTGKMLRYQLAENGKRGGGSDVAALGKIFFNGGAAFEIATEKYLGDYSRHVVLTEDVVYTHQSGALKAWDFKNAAVKAVQTVDKKGQPVKITKWTMEELASFKLPAVEALIKAGSRLYAAGVGQVMAIDMPLSQGKKPLEEKPAAITWQASIEGTAVRLLAADGKLFAVTLEGHLYCFGAKRGQVKVHRLPQPPQPPQDAWTLRTRNILETTNVRAGYCIVWGIGSGRLIAELVAQSDLHLIVLDPDENKVTKLRDQLVAAGRYGKRVAIHAGNPLTFSLPPYLASLMISENLQAAGIDLGKPFLEKAFQALRPYGGIAYLPVPQGKQQEVLRVIEEAQLPGAKARSLGDGDWVQLSREGALPGSANWTHEHADASNTRVSRDQLVKAPLGILWFGGPSNDAILPRHGHGPQPQVIDGRLVIEGVDLLRCMDIYTGRILWETRLPGLGAFYNNTAHQPGANAAGTNYISTPDGIYVVYGRTCLRLDPATGAKMAEFRLPVLPGQKESPLWGYINVAEEYLIGGADPIYDPKLFKPALGAAGDDPVPGETKPAATDNPLSKLLATAARGANDNMSGSKHLVVMDRHTGQVLWTVTAENWFRHNATCVGGGRLYTIDRLSGAEIDRRKKRGDNPSSKFRLLAFDLKTGKELWKTDQEVFGTWLSYSAKHDVLVESGRKAGDTLHDEPKGMRAYRAANGKVLWFNKDYNGPAMIHGDTILKDTSACDLLTGKPKMRQDPLTGQLVEWKWTRNHGCNTPAASEHLLTFRSGAAGYFDLCNDGGTGNFGGFRSSCTNNLIVAGGILSAPDYTRTCTCAYQNQTSLALIHMPEAEMWTFFGSAPMRDLLRRVGINFGAPGDRKAVDGTLWLEYPSVGGTSPVVPVRVVGTNLQYFRRHSSQMEGEWNWVAASGVKGLTSVVVGRGVDPLLLQTGHFVGQAFAPLPVGSAFWPAALGQVGLSALPKPKNEKPELERPYTVRLYFTEPDGLRPGQRLFNISLQGQEVVKDFDIAREAGGANRVVRKEIKGVKVGKELTVTFSPAPGAEVKVPLLCGLELLAEGW